MSRTNACPNSPAWGRRFPHHPCPPAIRPAPRCLGLLRCGGRSCRPAIEQSRMYIIILYKLYVNCIYMYIYMYVYELCMSSGRAGGRSCCPAGGARVCMQCASLYSMVLYSISMVYSSICTQYGQCMHSVPSCRRGQSVQHF